MTAVQTEVSAVVATLPAEQAKAVLDFARHLAAQAEEQAWDRSLANAADSAALRREVDEVRREIAAGRTTPLRVEDL